MESLQDMALCAAAFGTLIWFQLHPSKRQRERAAQGVPFWDWRS